MTDGWTRFGRDLDAVARDIEDVDGARREASELLAQGTSDEAPVVTGFLAGSVGVDDAGVGVDAIYAGVIHDHNNYAERAVDAVDWLAPFVDHVDDALHHLQSVYL